MEFWNFLNQEWYFWSGSHDHNDSVIKMNQRKRMEDTYEAEIKD